MIFEDQVLFYKSAKLRGATNMYYIVGLKLDCSSLIRMVYLQCSNTFWRCLNFVLFIYLLRSQDLYLKILA